MNDSPTIEELDPDELIDEVQRYLAAVETFRGEACEPRWQVELAGVT